MNQDISNDPRNYQSINRFQRHQELQRCRAEQRECVEYLAGDGKDRRGVISGLLDWFTEEILLMEDGGR